MPNRFNRPPHARARTRVFALHERTQRNTRARTRACMTIMRGFVLLLFYFRVSQGHLSLISATDTETPDLPMKTVNGVSREFTG
jgi:hypothetical protein